MLSPEELWNLDTKLDDGKPGYGIVIGPKNSWITPACTTTDVSATSVYDFSNTTKTCRFDYQIMVY